MKKTLIVYYSRTGITKKVAEAIKEQLDCDIEEIVSIKNRAGIMGYITSGREATQKTLAEIMPATKNPSDYDLVIIGTPVWGWNISSPIRTYLENYKEGFKNISAFCTMGGDGDKQSFKEIEKICDKKLVANLAIKTKAVQSVELDQKVQLYCATIISN